MRPVRSELVNIRSGARLCVAGVVLFVTACIPDVQPAIRGNLSRDRAAECRRGCEQLGLQLSAIVLMMNSAGCVCEPPHPGLPSSPSAAATAAAGRMAILATTRRQGAGTTFETQVAPPPQQQHNSQ